MADPNKLAALAQLAQTGRHDGSFGGAQSTLAGQRQTAMQGMASDAELHDAPGEVNGISPLAKYQSTAGSPYENFANALTRDQQAYDSNRSAQNAAASTYMSQVANARAATMAEADRAISQAASRASASGSKSATNPLTDADTKNIATGEGMKNRDATAEVQRKAAEVIAQIKKSTEGAKLPDQAAPATAEERQSASDIWTKDHPQSTATDPLGRAADRMKWEADRLGFVDGYAGQDRRGAEQQKIDAARQSFADGVLGLQRQSEAGAQNAQATELFGLPQYARQAAMDMNLHPEFGDAQEAYYRGMFPDMTPGDRTKAEEDFYASTHGGARNPIENEKQNREANALLGLPSGKETQALRPEAAAKATGVDLTKVVKDPAWNDVLDMTTKLIKPPKDPDGTGRYAIIPGTEESVNGKPKPGTGQRYEQVYTPSALTERLLAAKKPDGSRAFSDEMVKLVVTMYGPELPGAIVTGSETPG